jgi:hypothetical protein
VPDQGKADRMFRVLLAAIFLLTSSALIWVDMTAPSGASFTEVLGDLGTEMFGILVTIALVDWVLERRRKQDRARGVAWGVLGEIQQAVWVWQGGARHHGPGDLLGVISGISEEDEMEPFTEGLLLTVAFHSRNTLQTESSALGSLTGLLAVFKELEELASIEGLKSAGKARIAGEVLSKSVKGLAKVLGEPTESLPSGLIWHVDSTKEGQEKRYAQAWNLAGPGGGSGFRSRW